MNLIIIFLILYYIYKTRVIRAVVETWLYVRPTKASKVSKTKERLSRLLPPPYINLALRPRLDPSREPWVDALPPPLAIFRADRPAVRLELRARRRRVAGSFTSISSPVGLRARQRAATASWRFSSSIVFCIYLLLLVRYLVLIVPRLFI